MGVPKSITCHSCHQYRPHETRGMCRECWLRRSSCAGEKGVPIPCEHCLLGQGWTDQSRLCDECWQDESIQSLYGGKDGLVEHDRIKDVPLPEPTDTEPGSPENILIMVARYAAGQSLHHPADRKVERLRTRPSVFTTFTGGEGHDGH